MIRIFTLFISLFIFNFSYAQEKDFDVAIDYYNQKQYNVAQLIFENIDSDIALLYNAKCSRNLGSEDAIELFSRLLEDFPFSIYHTEVYSSLAEIYYNDYNFSQAIIFYNKIEDILKVNQKFNLAYSYFQLDSIENAKYHFSKLLNIDSEYQAASKYYFAHISYKTKNYQSSLKWFKELRADKKFKKIVPYYIGQIYYFLEDYNTLIEFLEPIIDDVIDSRKIESNRLLGESYYRVKDYLNATKYLSVFDSDSVKVSDSDNYMIAFSYYKISDYLNAITYFKKIDISDSKLGQMTSYYLGASYLRVNNNNFAMQAFKNASSMQFDKTISEEALFNYAKLSYELDLPFENSLTTFKEFISLFDSSDKQEHIKSLLVKLLKVTSNYTDAYNALKNKIDLNLEEKTTLQELAFFLGVKEFNNNNFDQAIFFFKESLMFLNNEGIVNASKIWLADAYYQIGEFENSQNIYSNISKVNDKFLSDLSLYNKGYTFFKLGEYSTANESFRAYIKSAKDSMFVNDALLRIADCYFMQKSFTLADKYYEKSIVFNLFDLDYSLYQRTICLGVINNQSEKLRLLKRLISEERNSIYFDDALFDIAQYYKNSASYDDALLFYDSVLTNSIDFDLQAKSYLSKAMVYYNTDEIDKSISQYKLVINTFQKGPYFKEALLGLQSIYVGIARVDEYITYLNDIPQYKLSQSEQDSLSYSAAFIKFSEQDYSVSRDAFQKYITEFKDGVFIEDAYYYLARSYYNLGDSVQTNLSYAYIVENKSIQYLEEALTHLSRAYFNAEDYMISNNYYSQLEEIVSNNSVKREVIIRLMYGFEFIDTKKAVSYAQKVLLLDKVDNWLLSKAEIIISRNDFESGNYAKARKSYRRILNIDNNSDGAEAMYMLIYLTYLDDSLDLAEVMIFDMPNNFSDNYYIAKSFILLSDIYLLRGDKFQAKATLESIIDNYDGEELILFAKKKREEIIESEIKQDQMVEKIRYIDIFEEELEYEFYDLNDTLIK